MITASPTSLFKGAVLTVSMRWADRLIGFVSTLILARLLVPADFGVIAMASLVVSLVDMFMDLGINVALIQNRNATTEDYHTAWTIRLFQSSLAALVIILAAPYAALYFSDSRLVPVLRIMALGMWLAGMENIGVVTFQKEMRFGLDFSFAFSKRITGFVATIVLAFVFRSYWAMVIGALIARFAGVLLSYRMHPMRPRLNFKKWKQIFSVSQWVLVNSIGIYFNRSLHKILVGRKSDASTVGGYTLADEVSAMPSTELLAPLNRVLFPAFVKVKHDPEKLKAQYLLAQGIQSLIGLAAGVGIALVAKEAIIVLLGEKWLFIVPFVQILAIAQLVDAIITSAGYVLITIGKLRSLAIVTWAQVAFVSVSLIMWHQPTALHIAYMRVAAVIFGLIFSVGLLTTALPNIRISEILKVFIRPLFGVTLMVLAVNAINSVGTLNIPIMFALKIIVGAVSYSATVLSLWALCGKPQGAESYFISKAAETLKRR